MITSGNPSRDVLTACDVAELIGREPSPNAGRPSGISQQRADSGGGTRAAAGGSRSTQKSAPTASPARTWSHGPSWSHAQPSIFNLVTLAALPAAHQHGTACSVEIALRQGERLADPQPCTPQHDHHAAQP